MKAMRRVEDFGDFQKIIDNNGVSLPLDATDFFDLPRGMSNAKDCQEKAMLDSIRSVQIQKNSYQLHWKCNLLSPNFLQKRIIKQVQSDTEFSRKNFIRGVDMIKERICFLNFALA